MSGINRCKSYNAAEDVARMISSDSFCSSSSTSSSGGHTRNDRF